MDVAKEFRNSHLTISGCAENDRVSTNIRPPIKENKAGGKGLQVIGFGMSRNHKTEIQLLWLKMAKEHPRTTIKILAMVCP